MALKSKNSNIIIALFEEKGLNLGTVKVPLLAFADDKVVTADSVENLQRMLSKLNTSMKRSLFTADGKIYGEIDRRTNEGRKVIGRVGDIIRSTNISNVAKIAIYNSILARGVLYGSETWTYQEKDKSNVHAIGMQFLRKVCGKTIMDKVSNETILNEYGVEETLFDVSERNMLRWFGHVERMKELRLTKQVYLGKMNGSVPRGRLRKQ